MWQQIFVVFAKEVMDNGRDLRSLLVALIYPLLGPILLGLIIGMVARVVVSEPQRQVGFYIHGAEHAPQLTSFLHDRGITLLPPPADPEEAVRNGEVNTVLVIPEDFSSRFQAQRTATIKVIANSSRLPGLLALNRMAVILGEFNRHIWSQRLAERGIDRNVLQPLKIKSINVISGAHIADVLLFMVPPLFIFNLFMGGVYLAIDTTSGERERGSLETLLINPIERWGLMLGKFLAALLFTAMAVTVQLLAFKFIFQMVGEEQFSFAHSLDILAVAGAFIIALPLMMMAVGIQFIIATLTRSFKEAQTYLGLLPLVPAIPGMVMVFSPVRTDEWLMAIPTFSQTLLMGQLIRGEPVAFTNILISMSSTTFIALVLIVLVARLYEREKLIFGG